jgi:sulfoxide reductase heme-binding subunit YedZ
MLAAWLKDHFDALWRMVFIACALPGMYLVWLAKTQSLGANPLATLMHTTGRTTLIVLTVTLTITPLRKWASSLSKLTHRRYGKRLADWNWLIRLRRQLGLWSFAYALAHAWIYAAFDLGYDWRLVWTELQEKPYIAAGALALAMLVPLAITSHQSMIRLLGRNWRRLHMLTYAVAITALLHFWWMMKPGLYTPLPYTLVLGFLLGYRLLVRSGLLIRWDGDDGSESSDRPPVGNVDVAKRVRIGEKECLKV